MGALEILFIIIIIIHCVCCSASFPACQPIIKCRRAFQALVPIAIQELCHTATSLIIPVRLGVARPTAPFSLVSANVEAVQVRSSGYGLVA